MDFAVIEKASGRVISVVDIDSLTGFDPGEGFQAEDVTGQNVVAGWYYKNGAFKEPAPVAVSPEALNAAKTNANIAADFGAENARLQYLTPGMGQGLTYLAKADEVRRYGEDTNPVKADYPFLSAEIGVTAGSLTAVVDLVRVALALWSEKGPQIERVRLKAKSDIAKADTVERVQTIVNNLEWP